MRAAINLAGMQVGHLTVLERVPPPEGKSMASTYWKCRCDCGNFHIVTTGALNSGQTRSCGCWRERKFKRPKA